MRYHCGLMSSMGSDPDLGIESSLHAGVRASTSGRDLTTGETEAGAQVGQATWCWEFILEVTLDILWPPCPC